jgi:hypothetical protein
VVEQAVEHRTHVEQGVSFAIEHAIALLDGGLSDGLCQVALARARRT